MSEELALTIRIPENSRFDLPVNGGKMQVDRLLAECQDGRLMEVTAYGATYKADGRLGERRAQVSIAPEVPADLSLGYDLHWDAIPSVHCTTIVRWCEDRGQKA
jgi:hypothetical protein